MAGLRDRWTSCLSAEDSHTHCSPSSRRQLQLDDEDDDDDDNDVCKLPDSVVVTHQRSDIIERLTEDKRKKHKQALEHLESELTRLTQVCEIQVRTISLELLSSLQDVDLRLNTLKDRVDHLDLVSVQEEVEEEVKLKKTRIMELKLKLTDSEAQRTNEIRIVLRKYLLLLENIGFLPSPDVCRLIHTEATMLNHSLLANRRSAARLLLLLQEENLQQEALLRLHLEDRLSRWRRSRVTEVVDRFRILCSSGEQPQLVSGQLVQEKGLLTEQRDDIISQICSLVPPSCSTALACDWFNQLTAVNQQIDVLHGLLLHQLRCAYESTWADRLLQVKLCEEELSSLQLSEEQMNDVVGSQLLAVIGKSQSQDEERLAALDRYCDSVARRAVSLSRCVFVVMRGAALLWETHSQMLERRREQVQQHLDQHTHSQQQHTQSQKVHLDQLLRALCQESSEEALKTTLDTTESYLQELKHRCSAWAPRRGVSDQWEVLAHLPSFLLEDLLSYSKSLSSFYHLNHTYTLTPEELQNLHPASTQPEHSEAAEVQTPETMIEEKESDSAQPSHDWLTEAESCLLDLSDISGDVTFKSSRGVAYSGPAFRCPAPDLVDDLQLEEQLSLFNGELLTHTLSRMRTLFFDHLEQHFLDVLSSAVAMVTARKEAASSEQEFHLKELNPQNIQTHIYQPRLAELQLHRQQVDAHLEEVSGALTSCRVELQQLQSSLSSQQQEVSRRLSHMEDDVLAAGSSPRARLQAVSSTLQDCLDQHIKHTQRCQTTFRRTVHDRLEQVRCRRTRLLNSFRLFSEGGGFAPQEVKLFQAKLKEETKQIILTENSIYSELEAFESKSLKQLKEASAPLEKKLDLLRSEVEFMEKIKKIWSSTQVHIKAEAARSKQQQVVIGSRLEDLRRIMENPQVSPDQVCSVLSSLNEELRKHCQYLDISLESLSASKSRKQVRSATPVGLLQTSRLDVDLLDDPVVSVIKSLNRFCSTQDVGAAEREERGRSAAVQPLEKSSCPLGPAGPLQPKSTESASTLSSVNAALNSVLLRSKDVLLLVAEDFYQSDDFSLCRFLLVPDSLDQWAESMQQKLLGYQEQIRTFLNTSREELETQLSLLADLLLSVPVVLISNHEQQQGAGLIEEMGRVRMKQEETLAASEEDKRVNIHQLRVSLRDEELQTLVSREELRQQQLHSAICSFHLELQVSVRLKGEEFVTSLAALTEQLLSQLDELPTFGETKGPGAEMRRTHGSVSRTWSGIPYLLPPTNSNAAPTTTASITTSRCTLGHQAVIEQRDTAVKRFEQLLRSESSRSNDDKPRRLSELQSWNAHWRQQIHTLKHTLETTDTHSETHTGDDRYTL